MKKSQQLVAEGKRWRKVDGPKVWRPGEGEVLIGTYEGRAMKRGSEGEHYEVVLVKNEAGVWQVSGTVIRNLFDGALVSEGTLVRLEYLGLRQGSANTYKDFNLYVQT